MPRRPEAMPRRRERPAGGPRLVRFTPAERWVHRTTAALMAVCVLTAACLYLPFLAELVGRRALMVTVHEWSGILLPAPLLLGLASRALRADLTRLNRYGPHDRRWLRAALRRRGSRPAGKFNAGQKLYAAWLAGAVLVMLGTGLLMWFTHLAPLVWRTGATFVHDWLALAVVIAIAGHVGKAYGDSEARRGMRTGSVDAEWARRHHPLWKPEAEDGHGNGAQDGHGDAAEDGHGNGADDRHMDRAGDRGA
ncbi:cytochrome b/b6 domain-containing protein [Streptomyces halobius]|uniref:Cytochrome b/b6 domain-containing protein n=1 Tax=Streptomyces halobius TaxID=2879846 RepID=A0ABY4MEY2_9ACTN|nr:cytochrome b/b6 domain-containing protein [Streptomyces halobius]UQA96334.1 cytochrome b/b6 domain-containing protein [Streptomyces halobius]